jgi:hypothetical protein
MTKRVTLKGNIIYETNRWEIRDLLKKYPGYIKIDFSDNNFRRKKYHGCDKLIIYAWRYHGEWSDPTKEIILRYYKPKAA